MTMEMELLIKIFEIFKWFALIVLISLIIAEVTRQYLISRDKLNEPKCYCPNCKYTLDEDSYWAAIYEYEAYECIKCGCQSQWNFDIAPVPILIRYRLAPINSYEWIEYSYKKVV